MNRDEAIEWLRARGVNASKRDWSLGASIFIPASPPRRSGEITCYAHVFYLYPSTNGSWILLKLAEFESETPYPDLESAAQAAVSALADSHLNES